MDLMLYLVIVLGALVVSLFVWVFSLSKRLKALSRGTDGTSLEGVMRENNVLLEKVMSEQEKHHHRMVSLNEKVMNSIQHVGVVRFNPYKETGGSQSFAIAFTNEKNNGVVMSSLYSRERVNVFAKPIVDGTSTYQLTKEEEQALQHAQEGRYE